MHSEGRQEVWALGACVGQRSLRVPLDLGGVGSTDRTGPVSLEGMKNNNMKRMRLNSHNLKKVTYCSRKVFTLKAASHQHLQLGILLIDPFVTL